MEKPNPRRIALESLIKIEHDRELSSEVIEKLFIKYSEIKEQDKRFIVRLINGTIERKITIDYILEQFIKKGFNKINYVVVEILRMSVYQIMYMDSVPSYAIVNEAIKLTRKKGFNGLTGFVNATLKNIDKKRETIKFPIKADDYIKYLSVKYSIPKEIIKIFLENIDNSDIERVLNSTLNDRTLYIRINLSKISIDTYMELLDSNNIKFKQNKMLPYAIEILENVKVFELPGYSEGLFVVQDISSVFAMDLVDIKGDELILDMCASPGGKTLHLADKLLQKEGKGKIISCDITSKKVNRIKENIMRVGFSNVETNVCDGTIYNEGFENKFDIVVLDAPCSGLGVISRKPDIKYNANIEGMRNLEAIQRKLIDNAVKYLKKGGNLVYSTCTIRDEENINQVNYILNQYNFIIEDNKSDKIKQILKGVTNKNNENKKIAQIIPGDNNMDGFFVTVMKKE